MKYTIFDITRITSITAFEEKRYTKFKVLEEEDSYSDVENYTLPGHLTNGELTDYMQRNASCFDGLQVEVDESIVGISLKIDRMTPYKTSGSEQQKTAQKLAEEYVEQVRESLAQYRTQKNAANFSFGN